MNIFLLFFLLIIVSCLCYSPRYLPITIIGNKNLDISNNNNYENLENNIKILNLVLYSKGNDEYDYMKRITEEYYKKRIQEQEKKLLKYREYSDIYQTFYTLGVELLRALISKRLDVKQASKERKMLRTFFNEGMEDVSFKFHSKLIQVTENFYYIE